MKLKLVVKVAVAAVVVTGGFATAAASILSAVPMQGGMIMPMIAYHAEHGHLHVMIPTEIPALTPLMVSNPDDAFDPGDPWFDALDPSRAGLSFSRRYGFVMDAMTDPLPAGVAIALRKLTSTAGLNFYRYSASEPNAWEPIFGTEGSPDAMLWNGMMFHPAVTASPGTNNLTATFEAYLVDTTSGDQIADTSTGPIVLNWTNLPDGRPSLELGVRFVVAWPANATGYALEWTDSLSTGNWNDVTNAPVELDGQPSIVLQPEQATKFFRMRKSP